MDLQFSSLSKAKRSREGARGAPKVKTGCQTCKIRRKKCDEFKPACSQCRDTGRRCDFFGIFSRITLGPGGGSGPVSDLDALYFQYFREVCASEFALYFELEEWKRIVLRATYTEPFMWHAALAIGCLSRSHYLFSGSEDLKCQSESMSQYSLRHYNRAIQELNYCLDDSTRSRELAIIGSIVFINIEFLQENENRVQMHLQSAFAILVTYPGASTCSMLPGHRATPLLATGGKHDSAFRSTPNLSYLFGALSRIEEQISAFGALKK